MAVADALFWWTGVIVWALIALVATVAVLRLATRMLKRFVLDPLGLAVMIRVLPSGERDRHREFELSHSVRRLSRKGRYLTAGLYWAERHGERTDYLCRFVDFESRWLYLTFGKVWWNAPRPDDIAPRDAMPNPGPHEWLGTDR